MPSYAGIGFDTCITFSLPDGSGFGKNVIIFSADMNSYVHIDNKKKHILILGKGLTDDTTLTAETEYSISFSVQQKKLCLSLHCNKMTVFC